MCEEKLKTIKNSYLKHLLCWEKKCIKQNNVNLTQDIHKDILEELDSSDIGNVISFYGKECGEYRNQGDWTKASTYSCYLEELVNINNAIDNIPTTQNSIWF